eukprot:12891392-Prorocentrum_lima.AAC.1
MIQEIRLLGRLAKVAPQQNSMQTPLAPASALHIPTAQLWPTSLRGRVAHGGDQCCACGGAPSGRARA